MIYGWLVGIVAALLGALAARKWKFGPFLEREHQFDLPTTVPLEPPVMPQEPSNPPKPSITIPESEPVTKSRIHDLACAIRDYEGKPGDANYRNCNPGNVRYNPGGYLAMYGIVKRSPAGFAIFKDMATGMLYLENMLTGMIHKRPNETILQFMTRYAPPSENNPVAYTHYICARLGIRPSTLMGSLV